MERLFLIVRLAGRAVALPARDVVSVVEIDEIVPVPRVAAHVAGLFALRSRVLTVIDSRAALGLDAAPVAMPASAVILACEGHSYALLVDAVEDVIEADAPEPCPALLDGGWAAAARGILRVDGQPLLLLDPHALVGGCQSLAA